MKFKSPFIWPHLNKELNGNEMPCVGLLEDMVPHCDVNCEFCLITEEDIQIQLEHYLVYNCGPIFVDDFRII